jgi:hypothetical protein
MKRALVLGSALAMFAALPAAAQTTFGIDAGLFSSYVWRGLTYSSKPVLQPDAYVSFPLGNASLTVGGWGNIELGQYDAPDIGEGGGAASLDFTEFDWWAEVGFPVGKATLTGGVTGYHFPNDFGFTSDANTIEVYGKAQLDAPLNPKVSAYYDVKAVKGFYIEGGVSHGIPIGPKSLTLGGLIGYSSNMDPDPDDDSFNFADNGISHIDLSASVGLEAGPFSITPSLHAIFGQDDFTKFRTQTKETDLKLWGGVTISWSKAFGGEAEE